MNDAPTRRSVNGSLPWIQASKAWATAAVPLGIALAFGFAATAASGRLQLHSTADSGAGLLERGAGVLPGVLSAAGQIALDSDLDGLTDGQEQVLGTSAFAVDTDGDGFSDAEELARNSAPTDIKDYPLPAATDIAMTARGENGQIRIVVAVYLADGDVAGRGVEVGMVIGRRQFLLDAASYLPNTTITQVPAANSVGTVLLLDVPASPNLVHAFAEISMFATLNSGAQTPVIGAASVDLLSRDGVVILGQDPGDVRPSMVLPYGGTGYGSVYNPIPPGGGGDIPLSWVPGEICYQASIVVGVSNGSITREIVGADCISGWDASCRADCSASVGETFDTFDPAGLVGY
jgi:Bacterial TSP3 repeat